MHHGGLSHTLGALRVASLAKFTGRCVVTVDAAFMGIFIPRRPNRKDARWSKGKKTAVFGLGSFELAASSYYPVSSRWPDTRNEETQGEGAARPKVQAGLVAGSIAVLPHASLFQLSHKFAGHSEA